jgi:ATP-dependent RNA helicase SUPV3L1/SUV3
MLKALDSQYKITEDGKICYQDNATNPLPGSAFAFLAKGDSILKPKVVMMDSDVLKDQDRVAVREHVQGWLARHMASVLEPLVALEDSAALKGPARGIAFQVHEAMGIVPREQIEDMIGALDQDDRRDLRGKKVRLGPILVFIPALNKPAAVRLRALLWGIAHDKTLPMECPKDGIVSFVIDPQKADKAFYQSVGYPVFGSRAIRIDMLDRVISAVYDSAKDGKFQAQHQMAEWLGCSIEGLYEVLEAMGHKKNSDAPVVEIKVEEPAVVESVVAEAPAESTEVKPVVQAKPELATFRLKKGKAFEKPAEHKKPFKKPEKKEGGKSDQRKPKGKGKPDKREDDRMPKIIQSGPVPKLEDSPFAILEQLKKKSDG